MKTITLSAVLAFCACLGLTQGGGGSGRQSVSLEEAIISTETSYDNAYNDQNKISLNTSADNYNIQNNINLRGNLYLHVKINGFSLYENALM